MTDIIKLPEGADLYADFAAYIAGDEIAATISETNSGTKHVIAAPGLDIIGKRVIRFEKAREGGRRPGSGVFVGWKKVTTPYIIEGAGKAYKASWTDGVEVCNYYVREV